MFLINDDVLLDQILGGKYTGVPSPYVTFMTNILGNFIVDLYSSYGNRYSWYGVTLAVLNFNILISILTITYWQKNILMKVMGIIVIILVSPSLIFSPTFTITAILLTGTGLLGLILYLSQNNSNFWIYLYFLLNMIAGYLVRVDAFLGVIFFLGIPSVLFLILHWKSWLNRKKVIQIIIAITALFGIFMYQKSITQKLIDSEDSFQEYVDIQKIPLIMTPASLKLHQNIIAGSAMKGVWSNIDYIVYRNWMHGDSLVFGSKNFKLGNASVSEYFGWQGFINADFKESLITIKYYLEEFKYLITFAFLFTIFLSIAARKKLWTISLITITLGNYFLGFYFLAATLRIPTRTSFPLILLLFIFLAFLVKEFHSNTYKSFKLFYLGIILGVTIFIVNFQFYNEFGIVSLARNNHEKIKFSHTRNDELLYFSKSAKFVGPIQYFPTVNQGVISTNLSWSVGKQVLPLSWATFSPYWITLASQLDLDSSNVYNSLAKQENVYWVSNSYLAEILEMYMNDRNIYRGKLCSVAKLTGPDQAEIFTYQAKEEDC